MRRSVAYDAPAELRTANQDRETALAEQEALLAKAEAEGRDLTRSEAVKFDRLEAQAYEARSRASTAQAWLDANPLVRQTDGSSGEPLVPGYAGGDDDFPTSRGDAAAERRAWASVERRDVDKGRRILLVRGTKTVRSRREVPLTAAALAALDQVPPRLDSRYVFTTSRKCPGIGEPGPFDARTSVAASGGRRSTPPASRSPRGYTTCGQPSPPTRSPSGSRCSSSPGSWGRA